MEKWRDIPGFEGRYSVSDAGRVKSFVNRPDGRVLRLVSAGDGYWKVCLCNGVDDRRHAYVHHLVLEAFVGPRPDGYYGCHANGDKSDNSLPNLRWGTPSSNNMDQLRHGTNHERNKTHCPYGHPLAMPNIVASEHKRGRRKCMACNRARAYAQRRSEPFSTTVADRYYSEIVKEAA